MSKQIMCFLFNWYNAYNREHITILNKSGTGLSEVDYLATHPSPDVISYSNNVDWRYREPPITNLSFSREDPEWYLNQLASMKAHGIDICLFDYWAFPVDEWYPQSKFNTSKLAVALQLAKDRSIPVPKIAMFVETAPFAGNPPFPALDLTTYAGGQRLFNVFDDFYSRIPQEHWSTIRDRPMAMMYAGSPLDGKIGNLGILHARALFREKYGMPIMISANEGWKQLAPRAIGLTCGWGAGGRPTPIRLNQDIAQIAPGYRYFKNDINDRRQPSQKKYREAWELLRKSDKQYVAIETWNEWHESSGIAESHEFGTSFLQITKQQATLWKLNQ